LRQHEDFDLPFSDSLSMARLGAVNMNVEMILYELGDYDGGAFLYPLGFIVTIGYVVVGGWVWALPRRFKSD